jgi:cyanate permease
MTVSTNRPEVFFGWWTVLVTGVVSGLGIGFYYYGFSALFVPIALELGISRAITSGAAGVGFMVGSFLAPMVGWIVDKFGPRLTTLIGMLISIIGLILMHNVNSIWEFYLVWGLMLGLGVNLGLTIAIDKALTNWFIRRIGLAIGTKFALLGFICAITLPSVSWLVSKVGWRITCLTWAAILTAGIPFILAFVRNKRPEYYGLLPDGEEVGAYSERPRESPIDGPVSYPPGALQAFEFGLREAMKTKAYWILIVCFGANFFIMTSFNTHCIPFLTEMDIDPVIAGEMMGIMLLFTIPSRFIGGVFADRVRKNRINLLVGLPFFLQAIGFGAFLANQSPVTVYVLLILYGIAHGLPTPLLIVSISRYFGRKAFGSIFGTCFLFGSPFALFSPIIVGWIFDTTESYRIAFILFTGFALFTTLMFIFLRPPVHKYRP